MLSIDETVEKLISEGSDNIYVALDLLSKSEKVSNAVLNAIGPLALLMLPPEGVKSLKYVCALCYLLGQERAKAEMFEESMKK